MPAKSPRINVVLEKPLYNSVARLADRDGVSLSAKVRDMLKDAVEINEDIMLARFAEKREGSLGENTLSHDDVWAE